MAERNQIFVLDMGQPVKIIDMAENLIRLSGHEPYTEIEIIEIGLRPGEKLYEELLVKKDELDRTENDMIFVEREEPLSMAELEEKLAILSAACATGSDAEVKRTLQRVVPTYRTPDEVNRAVAPDETENRLQKEEIPEVGTASKASRISAGAIG
jgi:FlaA1/EpsC-like NDP-sugar epimerase